MVAILFTLIYNEKWKSDFENTKSYLDKIVYYKRKLGESANILYEYLKLSGDINMVLDHLANYMSCKHDEDTKYQNTRIS